MYDDEIGFPNLAGNHKYISDGEYTDRGMTL